MTDRATVAARLRVAGSVWAEDEADLILAEAIDDSAAERMIARRSAGEPLELVLGWADFLGIRIAVAAGVFIPRRRTEFLAGRAAELAPDVGVAADLFCGTGAIGAVVLQAHPRLELFAVDLDRRATAIARRNLPTATVATGDLTGPLPGRIRGRIALITANVPYVPTDEIRLLASEAREWEPTSTLDGGADGLALLRRAGVAAAEWLAPGGWIISEVSDRQSDAAVDAFHNAGLVAHEESDDDLGATIVLGRRAS